jgi:hypothetical protein
MSGNQLSVGNYMVVSYNWIPVFKIYQCYVPSITFRLLFIILTYFVLTETYISLDI